MGHGLSRQSAATSFHLVESVIVASLIAINEWFLAARHSQKGVAIESASDSPFYPRHHDLLKHSGIGLLGEKFTYWLMQLTKRDMAMLAFVGLAILGAPAWVLHLLGVSAAVSLILAAKASRSTTH